jgi:uncharacterized protein YjbI with pentapeptide repeats
MGYGSNLLLNPSAETGSTSSWTVSKGSVTIGSGGVIGTKFFNLASNSEMHQTVTITTAYPKFKIKGFYSLPNKFDTIDNFAFVDLIINNGSEQKQHTVPCSGKLTFLTGSFIDGNLNYWIPFEFEADINTESFSQSMTIKIVLRNTHSSVRAYFDDFYIFPYIEDSGTGDPSEFPDDSIPGSKIIDGSLNGSHLANLSIGSAHIGNAQVLTAHINDAAITTAKIANAAITSALIAEAQIKTAHIENASITTAKILDAQITTAKIADAQITSAKIIDAQITTAKIATGAITTALIGDAQITTAKISDAAITSAKIVSIDAAKINAGTIDTGQVSLSGPNSKLRITGNRVQVFDNQATPIERVSMGDVNGDGSVYGFLMRAADGNTVLMDINGVKEAGITDGAITNPKIGQGAVMNNNIYANTITGDKLVADTITAREIAANTITAVEMVAGTITAASGIIADAAITSAKIADTTITAAKIADATITGAKIADATIASAKIISLDVNKLNAGSIMVGVDNLAFNAAQGKDSAGWSYSSNVTRDTTKTYKGAISFKSAQSGKVSPVWWGAKTHSNPYRVPCSQGEEFTGSVYWTIDNMTGFDASDNSIAVELEWYDAAGTRLGTSSKLVNPTSADIGKWNRMSVTGAAYTGATHVGIFFYVRQNGTAWFAAPQLQRGKFLTEYSPGGTHISSSGIMTSDITFTGTLSGANGTFSGELAVSGGNGDVTIRNGYITSTAPAGTMRMEGAAIYASVNGSWELSYGTDGVSLADYTGDRIWVDGGLKIERKAVETGKVTLYAETNFGVSEGEIDIWAYGGHIDIYSKRMDIGTDYGNIIQSYDEWLRINAHSTNKHDSGVYFGASVVRTDFCFQVGNGGSTMYVDGALFTYKGKEVLTGTNGSGVAVYSAATRLRVKITHNLGVSHTPVATAFWRTGDVGMDNVKSCYIENATVNSFDFVVAGTGFVSGNTLGFYYNLVVVK